MQHATKCDHWRTQKQFWKLSDKLYNTPRQQSLQGKPRLQLTDIILLGDSWLAVRSSESWFCFVWTGLCLAGGFNPLYPTGTVQQRHLYRPFLSIKPVVTFFLYRIQFHEHSKVGGPSQSRGTALHNALTELNIGQHKSTFWVKNLRGLWWYSPCSLVSAWTYGCICVIRYI